MSEADTTESGPRSMGDIQDTFAQMLTGTEEQPTEDSSNEEQPLMDSSDVEQEDAEFADDLVVDEQADEELDDEQLNSDAQVFTVTVDGQPEDVPLDELIAGYHRYATYTKKSQELAQERESFDSDQMVLRQTHQQYAEVLAQLEQQMQNANTPPDMDWDALERENPVQWLKLKHLEGQRAGEIQAVQAERVRMQQLLSERHQQERRERLLVQHGLVMEKIPEWADGGLQANEQQRMIEVGRSVGYSDEELDNLSDHRAVVVLRDAMRYRELTNGDRVTEAKSKIGSVRGGNKTIASHTRSRKQKAQRAKLKVTGKVDDAAAVFAGILAD